MTGTFVSASSPMASAIVANVTGELYPTERTEIIDLFGGLRSDQLGLSTIAYFPHVAWPVEQVEEIEQSGG